MARPKKTQTKKEETIEETPKKTATRRTTKKAKMHKLTFKPRYSAAEMKTFSLRETHQEVVGNSVRKVYKPIVPGLPQEITVKVGEIIEVNDEQLDALKKLGLIDTQESIDQKELELNKLEKRLRESPDTNASALISKLTRDNLILVE